MKTKTVSFVIKMHRASRKERLPEGKGGQKSHARWEGEEDDLLKD